MTTTGKGSSNNSINPTSSTSSSALLSSSSSSASVAKVLSEIDPIKQTKPSIKFLQYTEALVLFTNETLDVLKKMEQAEGDVEPDVLHSCEQNQGTYIIISAKPVSGAQDFKITFDNCYFRDYESVLTGELSVKIKTWNRNIGVNGTTQVHINQLSYVYKQTPIATISGDFEMAYATGEDFANKTITADSNITFKINNTTDFIKSISLSQKINYGKGSYLIDLNLHAADSQINSEFDLLTEQSLQGSLGRIPSQGNIKQVGYSNNLKYNPM